jgi:hypothetical protein
MSATHFDLRHGSVGVTVVRPSQVFVQVAQVRQSRFLSRADVVQRQQWNAVAAVVTPGLFRCLRENLVIVWNGIQRSEELRQVALDPAP